MQSLYSCHTSPISCLQLSADKSILVTGDESGRVAIWAATDQLLGVDQVQESAVAAGVLRLDISGDNRLLLVLMSDPQATMQIREVKTGKVVFSGEIECLVSDIRFGGSAALVATGTDLGMRFFVDENTSFLGENAMRVYNEKTALYSVFGRKIVGEAITTVGRFINADEVVAGTKTGHLSVWRGKHLFILYMLYNCTRYLIIDYLFMLTYYTLPLHIDILYTTSLNYLIIHYLFLLSYFILPLYIIVSYTNSLYCFKKHLFILIHACLQTFIHTYLTFISLYIYTYTHI